MLRLLGSHQRSRHGCTRREWLRAGGLLPLGLSLPRLVQLQEAQASPGGHQRLPGFGSAKQCILLYLYGAPSQLETFDLKPDAPSEIRSQFDPIRTRVPGLSICEHLPRGVKLVTVIWDEFQEANSAWDTHVRQVARLKDELLPGFDLAYSALLHDLWERGLLGETLVLVLTEHGRTPRLNETPGGGREHWSQAYCGLFAGAGIRRGSVLGATDAHAAFPREHPVSPKDVLCTIYHLLGIDPYETHLQDRLGRPVPLVAEGRILAGLLA